MNAWRTCSNCSRPSCSSSAAASSTVGASRRATSVALSARRRYIASRARAVATSTALAALSPLPMAIVGTVEPVSAADGAPSTAAAVDVAAPAAEAGEDGDAAVATATHCSGEMKATASDCSRSSASRVSAADRGRSGLRFGGPGCQHVNSGCRTLTMMTDAAQSRNLHGLLHSG